MLKVRLLGLLIWLSFFLLSSCATSQHVSPLRQRDAVLQLGADAAGLLIERAPEAIKQNQNLIIISRPKIACLSQDLSYQIPLDSDRLQQAMIYGLLSLTSVNHVLGWTPKDEALNAPNLWILSSQFTCDEPVELSDRRLYAYQLFLQLTHENQSVASVLVHGAFDSQAF